MHGHGERGWRHGCLHSAPCITEESHRKSHTHILTHTHMHTHASSRNKTTIALSKGVSGPWCMVLPNVGRKTILESSALCLMYTCASDLERTLDSIQGQQERKQGLSRKRWWWRHPRWSLWRDRSYSRNRGVRPGCECYVGCKTGPLEGRRSRGWELSLQKEHLYGYQSHQGSFQKEGQWNRN